MPDKKIVSLPNVPKRFKLGITHAGTTQPNLDIESFTLKELALKIRKHSGSVKFGAYFVRGEANYRNDASIKTIELITLDGDSSLTSPESAPDPKLIHEALRKFKINHLIYPSFSNSEEKTRWRAIIPCSGIENKKQLHLATTDITARLQQEAIPINPIRENYVLSQAWYITKPETDSPYHTDDYFYLYDSGENYILPEEPQTQVRHTVYGKNNMPHEGVITEGQSIISISPEEAAANIIAGASIHPSAISLAGSLLSRGVTPDLVKQFLLGLYIESEKTGARDSSRYANVDFEINSIIGWIDQKRATEPFLAVPEKVKFMEGYKMALDLKPTEWIIEGVLEKQAFSILHGPYSSYKSFLALDWGLCIATGIPWKGHQVKKGIVFMIIGEGHQGYSKRIAAWASENKVDPATEALRSGFFVSGTSIPLLDEESARICGDKIKEIKDRFPKNTPTAVFIDTLHRNLGGNENSAEDIGKFINNIEMYIGKDGFVQVVHHPGKKNQNEARGSYSLTAAVDSEYSVSKFEDQDGADVIRLANLKMKDSALFEEMYLTPKIVVLDIPNSVPETSLVLEDDNKASSKVPKINKVKMYIDDHPGITKNEIKTEYEKFDYKDENILKAALDKEIRKGKLINKRGVLSVPFND
jgi:hypothetical protein